jgi:hypothetical protein
MTSSKKDATLYDIGTGSVWRSMAASTAEAEVAAARRLGDTVQEYDTTDRAGNPLRVTLQIDATGSRAGTDLGGVYETRR